MSWPALAGWMCGVLLMGGIVSLLPRQPRAQAQSESRQIRIYTPQTSYSLPVVEHEGKDYVGLLEVLEPLGRVEARLDGKKWKLRFEDRAAQFQVGKSKAKVHKREITLGAPFLVENGRGFVPLTALDAILPEMLPRHQFAFHQQSRRLFLDKSEVHYSAELRNKSAPPQLIITFSAPVNPFVATEAGKLRMVFRREPLVPGTTGETQNFNDPALATLTYSERNGNSELTVSGNSPLLASFSHDRKTITIAAVQPPPQVPPAAATTATSTTTPPAPAAAPPGPAAAAPAPAAPAFTVVIDAAHGGDDRGAALSDKVVEKDVALAFARRLYKELEGRGMAARLLRDSDTTIGEEQRALIVNSSAPSVYLAIHVAAAGSGVHLFTSPLPPAQRPAVFLPWDSAQAAFVGGSQQVATAISTELLKRDIPALTLASAVRPLNSIAAPALALELAPPVNGSLEDMNATLYQQSVCSAIASALTAAKPALTHASASAGAVKTEVAR